ncbi:MAG: DUF1028 domain-containing protein [Terriglobales bacterium]|jgi:uncharacterized Ntn-hydrolase superfamily protein
MVIRRVLFALLGLVIFSPVAWAGEHPALHPQTVSTFSIVARDPATGQMGIAVASRYFSVGSVVPWAEADVGAVATQANVNVGYGPKALELLRQGLSAQQVADRLLGEDTFPDKDGRQFAIVDRKGNVVTHTGPDAPHWAGGQKGATWAAQGNILVGPQVPEAMGKAFEATTGELAEKLYAALKAGDAAGGDKRGRQSASMLIVCKGCGRNMNNDRYLYINVDDNPDPFAELRRLLDLNLTYNYQDQADNLLMKGSLAEARVAGEKAVHYAPENRDSHMELAFIDYAAGDKTAALREFALAAKDNPKFKQQWDAEMPYFPQAKQLGEDKAFLNQLFPEK